MSGRLPPLPRAWLQQGARRVEPDGALLQLYAGAQHPWPRWLYRPARQPTGRTIHCASLECPCSRPERVPHAHPPPDDRKTRNHPPPLRSGCINKILAQPLRSIRATLADTRMRMQLSNYLFFTTTCEDALAFYSECGLGQVVEMLRYGENGMPLKNEAMRGE